MAFPTIAPITDENMRSTPFGKIFLFAKQSYDIFQLFDIETSFPRQINIFQELICFDRIKHRKSCLNHPEIKQIDFCLTLNPLLLFEFLCSGF